MNAGYDNLEEDEAEPYLAARKSQRSARRLDTTASKMHRVLLRTSRGIHHAVRRLKREHDRLSDFTSAHLTGIFNIPLNVQVDRWLVLLTDHYV